MSESQQTELNRFCGEERSKIRPEACEWLLKVKMFLSAGEAGEPSGEPSVSERHPAALIQAVNILDS